MERTHGEISVHASAAGASDALVERVRERVCRVVRELGAPVARVHVQVVDDGTMARLHLTHSGLAGTTDVLTFPASVAPASIDVDIAVCLDEARRRADEFGHDVDRELVLYVLHGLLHCAGHDDHEPDAFARMHAEEDRILQAAGIGATFRPGTEDKRASAVSGSMSSGSEQV
ncbi:MAG: rRNA maturation RNase YbeY [Phycisphaerae bacterium]|nr:rRNA maturation RNase YbeY [Phycisphaerae bacterium]